MLALPTNLSTASYPRGRPGGLGVGLPPLGFCLGRTGGLNLTLLDIFNLASELAAKRKTPSTIKIKIIRRGFILRVKVICVKIIQILLNFYIHKKVEKYKFVADNEIFL